MFTINKMFMFLIGEVILFIDIICFKFIWGRVGSGVWFGAACVGIHKLLGVE